MTDEPAGTLIDHLVVGAALVDDLDRPTRVAAARRWATSLAGGWEFPGGKVEPGERPEDALHRELREELDLPVTLGRRIGGPLPDETWPIADGWRIMVWLALPARSDVRPGPAHDTVRWLEARELHSVPWLPADHPIVDRLQTLMGHLTTH